MAHRHEDTNVRNQPKGQTKPVKAVADPTDADLNVDHLGRIREIAMQLPASSPEGATTASQKILMHLDAHADPEAFKDRVRSQHEAEAEKEKARAARRDAVKEPVPEKDKAASEAAAGKTHEPA